MIKLKEITSEDNTFQMYHGGKRWSMLPSEILGSKQGRYEAGVGIYFTNDYNTARKYAKGSRVVHRVSIDKNFKEIGDVKLLLSDVTKFLSELTGLKHRDDIISSIHNNAARMQRDFISADILNNLIVNYESGAGSVGIKISNYLVSKGVDAKFELQSGDEFWLIVFNPKILKKVVIVDPKTVNSDFAFTLPNPYL